MRAKLNPGRKNQGIHIKKFHKCTYSKKYYLREGVNTELSNL